MKTSNETKNLFLYQELEHPSSSRLQWEKENGMYKQYSTYTDNLSLSTSSIEALF